MIRRPFFALAGLGVGLALGVWSVRAVQDARRRLTPDQLAQSAGARLGDWRERLALAVEQGRVAAAAREAELREVYRVREPLEPAE